MVESELKKYRYVDIGMATSYYFGLMKIEKIKSSLKAKWKDNFNEKCFHDSFLSFGLAPLDIIEQNLLHENLKCMKKQI